MTVKLSADERKIWNEVVSNYRSFFKALNHLCDARVNYVGILSETFEQGGDIAAAFFVARFVPEEGQRELFGYFVRFAASDGYEVANDIILSMSQEWVLANIERAAEPVLENGDYGDFLDLLALYVKLDQDLAKKLANRALSHTDPDVREVGQDYLNGLMFK